MTTQKLSAMRFNEIPELGGPRVARKIYANALTVAFQQGSIPFDQQKDYPVLFRNTPVGLFVPDLIAFGQ